MIWSAGTLFISYYAYLVYPLESIDVNQMGQLGITWFVHIYVCNVKKPLQNSVYTYVNFTWFFVETDLIQNPR